MLSRCCSIPNYKATVAIYISVAPGGCGFAMSRDVQVIKCIIIVHYVNHVVACSEICYCCFAILTEKSCHNLSLENIQYGDFSRVFSKTGINISLHQV